ncbi:MAG: hypothetical protein JW726_02695 [Anaerolineales bacterium]|nr:hypothetical protein [Anaerolineales bacterium]
MDKAPKNEPTGKWLRLVTRLMIGGVEVGLGKLFSSLESLDQEFSGREMSGQEMGDMPKQLEPAMPPPIESAELAGDAESSDDKGMDVETSGSRLLNHALIGLFFEVQDGLQKGIEVFDQTSRAVSHLGEPWLRPLQHSRLLRPLRRQVDRLAERGEAELMHWVERGRQETEHGRRLVNTAISSTVDRSIETLTTNPEVQELVQKQSTGLANEMLEEVRERTVSADNFLEGIARRILRRKPREELPEPPFEVIERAASARSKKGK